MKNRVDIETQTIWLRLGSPNLKDFQDYWGSSTGHKILNIQFQTTESHCSHNDLEYDAVCWWKKYSIVEMSQPIDYYMHIYLQCSC